MIILTSLLPAALSLSCGDDITSPENQLPKPEAAPPSRPTETAASVKPPEEDFDQDRLDAMLAEAKEAYESAMFDAAVKKYGKAENLASLRPKLENKNIKLAGRMIKRCTVFGALLADVRPEIFGDRKMIFRFTMYSGRRFIAKALNREGSTIKILKENGTGGTIEREDILKEEPLDEKAYHDHLINKLEKDESEAAKNKNYFAFFNCTYFAAQHKMKDRITELLEKTFACKGSEDLISIFCPDEHINLTIALLESFNRKKELLNFRIRLGLAKAEHNKPKHKTGAASAGGFRSEPSGGDSEPYNEPEPPKPLARTDRPKPSPEKPKPSDVKPEKTDSDGIDRFGKTADDDIPDISKTSKVTGGSGVLKGNPDFVKVQKLLSLAQIQYRLSMPGQPDAAGHAKKAQDMLERALDILDPLINKYPDNSELEQLGQQISYLLHAIIKNRGVND
ncbi:MAG: hypothetical protein ACYS8W_15470 [Planctomycetota bacterium]